MNPASITSFYDVLLQGESMDVDESPTTLADAREQGAAFGFVVDRLEPGAWRLTLPLASPAQLFQLQSAFQATGKGILPMRWTPPEGDEEIVVFVDAGIRFQRVSAVAFSLDFGLERWHG